MDKRPIGIFDSGLGGLTVLKEIRKALPTEDIVYLGDTARVPYGTRSKKTIEKFSLQCAYFLAGKGVKCIVVACNTASSNAIDLIRREIKLPIFDVVSSSIEAIKKNKKGARVGVAATSATINTHVHKILAKKLGINIVMEKACPLFVPLAENGENDGEIAQLVSDKYLKELRGKIDVLVLGCTHYPVLEKAITKSVGSNVFLVNPAIKLAEMLRRYLVDNGLQNPKGGKVDYFVTDISGSFAETAKVFLGKNIDKNVTKTVLG
jgi:glutamate racemase